MLPNVTQNPEHDIPKQATNSLWSGAKYLASKAWENRDSIISAVTTGLSLLAVPNKF